MEDQTNGYIYEIASPVELGAAGYRARALIVRPRRDDAETAHPVRVVPAQTLSQVLWSAGLLLPRTEETTP